MVGRTVEVFLLGMNAARGPIIQLPCFRGIDCSPVRPFVMGPLLRDSSVKIDTSPAHMNCTVQ